MKHILSVTLAAVALASVSAGQMKVPPKEPNRIVYDYANLLDAEARASIEKISRPLFQAKRPIIVMTVNNLEEYRVDASDSEAIKRFANLIYNDWGIGSRTTGQMGALILVSKEDRKMWIAAGEGVSTPYKTEVLSQVANEVIQPNFKAGDYAGGLREGVIAIRDRVFQPSTNDDLQNIPVEADGTQPKPAPDVPDVSGVPGDLGLPGPAGATPRDDPAGGAQPRERPQPRTNPQPPGGGGLNFDCGKWFCFAIGILILISMFRRRRRYGYGYGPTHGPPPMGQPPQYGPRGYGHRPYGGGGLGGMLGGILTGVLLGRAGRHRGTGGGGSTFGGGGGSGGGGGGSVFGGGGSGGGGGGGFGSGFGGGRSGGGGAGASW